MISPGTTIKITATDGENPEKKSWVSLNIQKIFSAFLDNDAPMKQKRKDYEEEVLREKIISVPFVETNIDFETLDISNKLTNTEKE